MKNKLRQSKLSLMLCATLISSAAVQSAPMTTSYRGLPMPSPSDVSLLVTDNNILEEEVSEFMGFVASISVMPDHRNPDSEDAYSNRNEIKRFYLSPRFSPVADGQTASFRYATSLSAVIQAGFELTSNLGLSDAKGLGVLFDARETTNEQLLAIKNCLASPGNSSACGADYVDYDLETLQRSDQILTENLANINSQIDELISQLNQPGGVIGVNGLRNVANELRLKYSELGYKATANEVDLIGSNKTDDIISAIASMQANVANLGTYGILGINYRSGYTEKEWRFLTSYRKARPDVRVQPITGTETRVAPTFSSLYRANTNDPGTGLTRQTSTSPIPEEDSVDDLVTVRGVNIGSDGVCGGSTSCTVSIEYTYNGAQDAYNTRFGADLPGIIFQSDMVIAAPEFHGVLDCKIQLGWEAKGKDSVNSSRGGIFRRSKMHVHNGIKFNSVNDSDCDIVLYKGDVNSAEWALLNEMEKKLQNIYTENLTPSNDDMAAYRDQVAADLQAVASGAKSSYTTVYGKKTLVGWQNILGGGWATTLASVVTYGFGGGGMKYTRTADTEFINNITVNREIRIDAGATINRRITFDSNSLLCWKVVGSSSQLEACEWDDVADANNNNNQNVNQCEDEYGYLIASPECQAIGENNANPDNDDDGDGNVDDPTTNPDNQTPDFPDIDPNWDEF